MLKVGLTGGIGSGKSTICKVFNKLNVPIYYSDIEARNLVNSNADIVHKVKKLFGDDIYVGGQLNRKAVSDYVFRDKDKLAKLNSVVHPAVKVHYYEWTKAHKEFDYTIIESAILIESGSFKNMDLVITVNAPVEIRIERVKQRDGLNEHEIESRIRNQLSDQIRSEKANYIINCNDEELVVPQVVCINNQILEYIKRSL